MKKIAKKSQIIIKEVEKELAASNEVYIDKTVNKKIEREISNLGKEKLVADHLKDLAKDYNGDSKNKILFLLVKLYNLNKQVHESLISELRNDKKLLSNRIKTKMSKSKVRNDIYKKLLHIADRHYKFVRDYAKKFNPRKKYHVSLISSVVGHKRKAEAIYKALANINARKTLHSVLVRKLDVVFQSLIDSTADLSKSIAAVVNDVRNDKIANLKTSTEEIDSIISSKVGVLREFAYKYSYNVIHSDHFLDFDGNSIVVITPRDHRHLAV